MKNKCLISFSDKENYVKVFIKKNIYYTNLVHNNNLIYMVVDVSDINVIKGEILSLKIIKYYGTIGLKAFIKKHYILMLSFIFSLLIIYTLSNIIFDIEVITNNSKLKGKILDLLKENNIEKYKFAPSNEKITNDLKSYLENEKQKLENYLLTGENRPYEDMDKFILSIRTYLNITLLSIRNYLNKEEILDVIRDYTSMQMQINYKEPIKNYLSIVLLEIDKIKNEIFDINPTNLEVHNIIDKINIDYSNMESNEIIKYVDSILMEMYGLYYKIKFNNTSKLKKESYKMRLLKWVEN